MKKLIFRQSWIVISLVLSSCSSNQNQLPPPPSPEANRQVAASDGAIPQSINPENARVTLFSSEAVSIDDAASGSRLQVPVIRIADMEDADFVQILRCNASYKTETASGASLDSLEPEDPLFEDHMRWIWKESAGSPKNCRFVGTRIVRTTVQDLSAISGNFFYIVNPCVSKERSITDAEGCSFHLVKTDTIEYENNLSDDFLENAEKLSDAEADLAGIYQELYGIARRIKLEQDECERVWRDAQARSSFFSGIVSLLGYTVGAVVGSFVAGPVGAAQGGRLAMGLAGTVFGPREKPIDCKVVDSLVKRAESLPKALEDAAERIDAIRSDMGELESDYRSLDRDLQDEYTLWR